MLGNATEDAVIKLYAPTIKVAIHAAVRTDSQEMDSPVQVSYVIATHWITTYIKNSSTDF